MSKSKELKINDEYWEEKLFTAQAYYYSVSDTVRNTYNMIIEMDEKIDGKTLRFAADKCCERYPYLMVRTKNSHKETKLIHNNNPIMLKETKNPVTLGTEEMNYHLLALTFFENKLVFSVFHGLLDGNGSFEFLRTLLYYYITKKYHENPSSEKIRMVGDDITQDEYTDPLETLLIEDNVKPNLPRYKHKKPFRIEADPRITKAYPYRYYMRIPKNELLVYCKENDSSPASLFSLLTARTIKKLNPDTQKPIICGLCQNMRSALDAPKAHHSIVGKIMLTFDEKENDMSYEKQNTAYRGRIILSSDKDYVRADIRSLQKFYRFVRKLPLLCIKKYLIRNIRMSTDNHNSTFVVSYTGMFATDDIEKHIKSFYTDVDAPDSNIMLEVNSANEYFFLSFMQEWRETLYFDAFCKEIEAIGLRYEITGQGELVIPFYK